MNQKTFKNAVEIGAGDSHSSILLRFPDAERITLYEPNESLLDDLSNFMWADWEMGERRRYEHVKVLPLAIIGSSMDVGLAACLVKMGYASFLTKYPSFMNLSLEGESDECWGPLKEIVPCLRIDQIDDGSIDFLVLTIGGGEHLILKRLVSRPKIILTKYYCHNAAHWEQANKISAWMLENNYSYEVLQRNEHGTFWFIRWILNK